MDTSQSATPSRYTAMAPRTHSGTADIYSGVGMRARRKLITATGWCISSLFIVAACGSESQSAADITSGSNISPGSGSTGTDQTGAPDATVSSPVTTAVTTTTTLPRPGTPSSPVEPVVPIDGRAALIRRVDTTDRVVFLTIDDGIVKDPLAMDFLVENQWPATLFLVAGELKKDPAYFARIFEAGGMINSHTLTHPSLKGMSLAEQTRQICGMADLIRYGFGQVGHLMRPPYGSYDENTRRATAACGLNAVVMWNSSLWEGNIDVMHRPSLQPGDIFLTHFRRDLLSNLMTLKARIEAEGFTIGRLEDYLPVAPDQR